MKQTASAVICCNNRILFFKRDNIHTIPNPDKWQLPGGHVEENETPSQAIQRELMEEVSYCPLNLTLIGSIKTKVAEAFVYWSFVTTEEMPKFLLGKGEGQAIKFMTVEEALTCDLTNPVKFYLQNFSRVITNHLKSKTIPTSAEFDLP